MQSVACRALQQGLVQPVTGSGRAPAPLATPQSVPSPRRRSDLQLACRARKARAEVAPADAAATTGSGGGGGGGTPAPSQSGQEPPPLNHQQHAQPPPPGAQQQQQQQQQDRGRTGAAPRPVAAQQPSQLAPSSATSTIPAAPLSTAAGQQPRAPPPKQQPSNAVSAPPPAAPRTSVGRALRAAGAALAAAAVAAGADTQLIFRFERRGDGWAEEIFPHLVVEQRPLEKKKKRAYSRPDPWKEGSLECYMVDLGVPPEDVDRVVTQAVAWRVTPGGRSLIDRRRRSRVERNVRLVVEHLEMECQVPFGPKGIAAILARCPEIMLCKPTTNDRWDRRAVELSAYLLRNGHCNVPEDWDQNPELGLWVKRQRIARAAGQLSDERLSILQSMGFAFGEVAQLTEEWEHRFDQLVDWMLWHNENQQPFSWLGADWGARGGITARELALWTTLQREYRARGLLPGEALSRFDAIGVQWDSVTDGTPSERRWMTWFGRLLYLIERHNTLLQQPRRSQLLQGRPKMGRPRGSTNAAIAAAARAAEGGGGGGGLAGSGSGSDGEDSGGEMAEGGEEEEEPPAGTRHGGAVVAAARLRLQEEMAARRAALSAADMRAEPGLRFWLQRQRRRWRRQELRGEMALMLQLAGVQLDTYSPGEWQAIAHMAAALLQGSQITLGPAAQQAQQQAQHQQHQHQHQRQAWGTQQQQGAGGAGPQMQQQQQQGQQQQGQQQGQPPRPPVGSVSLRVARWVETQQALFAEGKLSAAQLRYMAFLGLTWVLSDEVTHMAEGAWQGWCQRLASAPRPLQRSGELWEWLQHQRGLHALGWLPLRRRKALAAHEVQLDNFERCPADVEWDARLSELLAYKAEHGHCRLAPPPSAASAAAAATAAAGGMQQQQQRQQQQARWAGLAAWLGEQHRLVAAGRLPAPKAAQLAALGAAPPPRVPQAAAGAAAVSR